MRSIDNLDYLLKNDSYNGSYGRHYESYKFEKSKTEEFLNRTNFYLGVGPGFDYLYNNIQINNFNLINDNTSNRTIYGNIGYDLDWKILKDNNLFLAFELSLDKRKMRGLDFYIMNTLRLRYVVENVFFDFKVGTSNLSNSGMFSIGYFFK